MDSQPIAHRSPSIQVCDLLVGLGHPRLDLHISPKMVSPCTVFNESDSDGAFRTFEKTAEHSDDLKVSGLGLYSINSQEKML